MKPGRYRLLFTKRTNLINIVMCWCLAFVGSAPLFFTFESGRFQFPSREAMCLITFEDDRAFIIFSNVFDIATPFAIITVCCVKVFHAVSRSNRVFSHKNNPQRSGRKWKKQKWHCYNLVMFRIMWWVIGYPCCAMYDFSSFLRPH